MEIKEEKLSEGKQIIEDTLKMFLGQSLYTTEKKDDKNK